MDPKLQHGFRLGECVVHPLQGLVERPDGSDHVQPKVMEVLLCLAERPGEVVERDDLVTKVWAKTAVTDEVLTRCISELRHALGDHRDSPRYVQTIPKRGYRLVASVQAEDSHEPASGSQAHTSSAALPGPDTHPGHGLSFWSELRRRNVPRVLIAYAAVAWVIIEVASVVFPIIDLPDWSLKLVVALAFLGFPVAAVLAWAVQLTPQGLVLDVPVADRPMPVPVESRRQLDRVILMALLIAVGILSYREFFWEGRDRVGPPAYQNSVAVLRFLNIGDDADDTVFSDGLAEELLNVLTRVDELKVPDRKWTWQLAAQGLNTPELARILGVQFVLSGSVRTEGDFIRVTAQLVDKN
ncbi:MAG: winged helix-turn-helix domain-containing protein, partial [Gammaproteobacteria bacterium]